MKNIFGGMFILIVFLAIGYYFLQIEIEEAPPLPAPIESPAEERIIFETNLPIITNGGENNFFVVQEPQSKNIKVFVLESGVKKEIPAEEFKRILLSANENESPFRDEGEYFVIQPAVPGNDPDIGLVHSTLDPLDFSFSSGYVLEESLVSSQKNICISTSAVYNNWGCFIYDTSSNDLKMSYAQNFAD